MSVRHVPQPGVNVAVIGGGAAGLSAAWLLQRGGYNVTLFEAFESAGGHARTIPVPIRGNAHGATVPVDVGFMVYNNRTYPDLVSLFEMLDIEQENSSMSFACSCESEKGLFEWGSEGLSTLFADRKNIVNPSMYAMLWDVRRFNRSVHQYVDFVSQNPDSNEAKMTLGEFLDDGGYTHAFITYYIIPMVSAVWSASLHGALSFPAISLFHFFVNHGLAQVFARPQWRTPAGRSKNYVRKMVDDMKKHGATVLTSTKVTRVERSDSEVVVHIENESKPQCFDQVVFATHAPTTLEILGDGATDEEKQILGCFKYSSNRIQIHSDSRLMPRNRAVWSSWNFISRKLRTSASASNDGELSVVPAEHRPVCVTYWLNRLQNLQRYAMDVPDIFVTLNSVTPIDDTKVLGELSFAHPQFTLEAVNAQKRLQEVIQGRNRSWFCGAYARYGFHEDAFMTGLDVAERLSGYKVLRPWMAKLSVAMSNNNRVYDVPFATPRTPLVVFWCALIVINIVIYRLARGLSRMSAKMIDDDPAVIIASGDGHLQRFGPRRAPRIAKDGEDTSNPEKKIKSQPARVTIRSAKVFARVTDLLRKGYDLAPILAASFAAREVDSPTPRDLSKALCALFVAQTRNRGLAEGYRGRMRLAESLLVSLVGGFDAVKTPATQGRLPELVTSLSGVVYPAWWRFLSDDDADSSTNMINLQCHSDKAMDKTIRRRLELLGDLSGATIDGLKADEKNVATVVVISEERATFVKRKAQLIGVDAQVKVVLIDEFLSGTTSKGSSPNNLEDESGVPGSTRGRFDLILSPAAVNLSDGPFGSVERMMNLARSLIADDGVVEFGFTSFSENVTKKARRRRNLCDQMFSGDKGYKIWHDQEVLDCASGCGLALVRISQMDGDKAAEQVEKTIQRVHSTMAETLLTEQEIRETMAQLCLWEAALKSGYISRRVALLKPS